MPVTLQLVVPPGQVHSSEAEASVARGQSFDSVLFTVMTPSSTVRTPKQLEPTFPSINYSDADVFGYLLLMFLSLVLLIMLLILFFFLVFFPETALLLPANLSKSRHENDTSDIRRNLRLRYKNAFKHNRGNE